MFSSLDGVSIPEPWESGKLSIPELDSTLLLDDELDKDEELSLLLFLPQAVKRVKVSTANKKILIIFFILFPFRGFAALRREHFYASVLIFPRQGE